MSIRSEERPKTAWWTPRWWIQDARWLGLAAVGLVSAGHMIYGAMLPKTALTLALTAALLLLGACATPAVSRNIGRLQGVGWPAILFGLVLLAGLLSLTPFAPGGAHPVWSYVGLSPGSATLDRSQTELELLKLLGLGTLFALGLCVGQSDGRTRAAIGAFVGIGAAIAAWSFLAWASGAGGIGRQRLGGPFEAPNTAATLFGCLLVVSLGLAMARFRSAPRGRVFSRTTPMAAAALLFLFGLLATASRGGFLATAAGLLTLILLQLASQRTSWSKATIGLLVGVVLLVASIVLGGDLLVDRLLEQEIGKDARRIMFQAHWETFKGAPWMGYGLGTFDTVNRLVLDALNLRELWNVRAAHNVYLTWLQQAGLLGALPMFGAIAACIGITARNTFSRSRMTTLLFALLAMNVVILVHGVTDFALETYSMAALWSFLLGVQLAASQGSRRR